MKRIDSPYKLLDTFVLRTPLLHVNFILDLTNKPQDEHLDLLKALDNPIICEAIKIASPAFFKRVAEWKEGKVISQKKEVKLKITILKYLIRISTRSTPFGLFAGCSTGSFGQKTKIVLTDNYKNKVFKQLESKTLMDISQLSLQNYHDYPETKWFPNSSLYKYGKSFRFIESHWNKGERTYSLEAVRRNDLIDKVVRHTKVGTSIQEILELVRKEGFLLDEATNFVNQLIESQLLVSDLELPLTTGDFINVLENGKLIDVGAYVSEQQKKKINNPESSKNLMDKDLEFQRINRISYKFDLFKKTKNSALNTKWIPKIMGAIRIFNKMSQFNEGVNISRFKQEFIKRFGTSTVPLAQVLDVEHGINYLRNKSLIGGGSMSKYIDALKDNRSKQSVKLDWNHLTVILNKKVQNAIRLDQITININDSDFEEFEENWENLPISMSGIAEFFEKGKQEFLFLSSIGGTSAINLLSRFSSGDEKIYNLVREIGHLESSIEKNKLVADVVHMPSIKSSDFIRRPNLREWEIPYLGRSCKDIDSQLSLNDLMITVRNGQIKLTSCKHGKEVLPILSCSHNYQNSPLPIYQFLCEVGTSAKRTLLKFDWGCLSSIYTFLPRVTYKNIILNKARWVFETMDIKLIIENIRDPESSEYLVSEWRKKYRIPKYVVLVEGDNTLLINFDNYTSLNMLIRTVKNKKWFELEEFLFSEGSPVRDEKGNFFANQFVFSFCKN